MDVNKEDVNKDVNKDGEDKEDVNKDGENKDDVNNEAKYK